MPQPAPQVEPQRTSFGGCLLRTFWMILGNAALLICSLGIVNAKGFSSYDVIFWGIAGLLLLARFCDIRYLHGQTGTGEPATWGHFRTYVLLVLVGSLMLWGAAHATGRFL